jgi:cation-transporting ATPase 13A2
MSVITRSLGDKQFHVYVKGAPEKIIDLCRQDSIPKNFHNLLSTYTLRGFRVIGLAKRVLPPELHWIKVHKMKRDEVIDKYYLGIVHKDVTQFRTI